MVIDCKLYRVSLYREDVHRVSGLAYIIADDAKHARMIAERFRRSYIRRIYNNYNRVCKAVSICGKRTQKRIRAIKHGKGTTSLYKLFLNADMKGVIAYSCCRTCLNMDTVFELRVGIKHRHGWYRVMD